MTDDRASAALERIACALEEYPVVIVIHRPLTTTQAQQIQQQAQTQAGARRVILIVTNWADNPPTPTTEPRNPYRGLR